MNTMLSAKELLNIYVETEVLSEDFATLIRYMRNTRLMPGPREAMDDLIDSMEGWIKYAMSEISEVAA